MSSSGGIWSGTYASWSAQLASSACCASCSNQGPYHRHCGCSLHQGSQRLMESGLSKCHVQIAKKFRTGMFRSVSVQNFGQQSSFASSISSSSGNLQCLFDESLDSESSGPKRDFRNSAGDANDLTVTLMEELATLIQTMKSGQTVPQLFCSLEDDTYRELDREEVMNPPRPNDSTAALSG